MTLTTPYDIPDVPTVEFLMRLRRAAKEGDYRAKLTLDELATRRKANRAPQAQSDRTVASVMQEIKRARDAEERRRTSL